MYQDQVTGLDGILSPDSIEFWLDGENRIHERLKYNKDKSGKWIKSLLSP